MEGGHALAGILDGSVAPSGRLPFAIPAREADLVHFDPDATAETYDLFHGQWHLDRGGVAAAFPFGAGLTTTTFALDDVRAAPDQLAVVAHVRNTGRRAGTAVVQVYGSYETSAYLRPAARLVGFARVELEPGHGTHVGIPVDLGALDVRADGAMHREPGTVRLRIAFDATDPGVVVPVSV
jgi:beta-glucosidase